MTPTRKLCQRCCAHRNGVTWLAIPQAWHWSDPAGVIWHASWLCASCAEDARRLIEMEGGTR
jgi:hypothetical protein